MIFESDTDGHSVEVTGRHCTVKTIIKRRFVNIIMKKKILMTIMIMKKMFMMLLLSVLMVDQVQPSGCFRLPLWHRVNDFLNLSSGETHV